MRKGSPSYSFIIAFEEAFRTWEGKLTHPPHLSEWRPVITSSMSWRTEAKGHTFQPIIHSPAWMEYRSPGAGGGSSGRAEFAAACLALEDSLTHDQPIVVLTDSKEFMTVASNWVGGGKDPFLRHSPDGSLASSRFSTKG